MCIFNKMVHLHTTLQLLLNIPVDSVKINGSASTNPLWPPLSSDLTLMDIFFWGYLKDIVYLTPPENIKILLQTIITACRDIPPYTVENAVRGATHRWHRCILQEYQGSNIISLILVFLNKCYFC